MELDQLRALVAVDEAGTLAAAARTTGMSRTTLRRRLAGLGAHLGTEVVVSDGRDVAITPIGRTVVAHAREILALSETLASEVRAAVTRTAGSLCVLAPPSLHPLAAAIAGRTARNRFPELTFDVRYVDDPIRHLDNEGDLALHWGAMTDADVGARIAKRIRSIPLRLHASRAYIEDRGLPTTVEALADHDMLTFDGHGLRGDALPLLDGSTVSVRPSIRSTNLVMLHESARLGGGIALLPDVHLPGDSWAPEEVVRVLPDVAGHDLQNWVVGREVLSRRAALVSLIDEIATVMDLIGA